jgi:hypothetical protein
MEGEQIRPQASGLGAQHLTLRKLRRGEARQGDEAHDAVRPHVRVGRRPPPFPPPQDNTAYSLEQMPVNGQRAIHPSTEAQALSPSLCRFRQRGDLVGGLPQFLLIRNASIVKADAQVVYEGCTVAFGEQARSAARFGTAML